MRKILTLIILFSMSTYGQSYVEMMEDTSVNFYDVCEVAETYFDTIDKSAKGSGYKGFLRWKEANEYKFFPTGRRDNVDPHFANNAFNVYKQRFPEQLADNVRMSGDGWRELGPNSIDEITGHYAAGVGRIEEVYADPANMNKLYLGSRSGGLWRSLNEGFTWQGGASDFLPGSGVNTFGVDPFNTDHLLVNVRNSRNGTTYGIYESIDGGETLTQTAFNPTNLGEGGLGSNFAIHVIAYHPTIANMVFVGTNNGLYKSTDAMTTWTEVNTNGSYTFIKFHPTNAAIIYSVSNSNGNRDFIYKSSNTGDTFVTTGTIAGNANRSGRIEVSANAPSNVYFANSNGIHKSTDNGDNFNLIAVPSATGGVGAFGINSQNELNMITGGIDAYRSDDEGLTFAKATYWSLGSSEHGPGGFQERYDNSTVYVHADLRKINSINGVFYMGTDGTMVKSVDGGTTWVDLMRDGVGVRENYKLGVSQSNNGIAISGSQDNGTSIYKNTGWIEFYGADGMEGLVHPLNDDWMIGSVQFGSRRRTKDGGFSQGGVTPSGSASGYWQAPIAYDPLNHMTIYDFRDGVRKSEDFGTSYTLIGTPTFSNTMQLAEIAQNDSQIMAVSSGSSIDKSVDGGATFSSIKGSLPNHSIQDIAFDPLDDNVLIVVNASYQDNGEKVYVSTNGGGTWSNITFNIGNIPVHSVVIDHSAQSNIYLGTEVGVYTKPMASSTWILYSTDLPNTTIEELEINFGANTIKGATWGRGLWEFDLVGRASYPSFEYTEISDMPTDDFPKENVEQFVTSNIDYMGTLSNVYVRWSIGTPDFSIVANTVPMSNTSGNTWVSDTEIPNQPEGTKVYFKVFADGDSSDFSETYKFMYTVKPFAVCDPSVQNGTSDFINLFEVEDASATIFSNASANDGFTTYANTPIEMALGEVYTFNVQLQGAFNDDDAGVWIDFNQNATFEISESVTMSSYNGNVSTGSIQIPLDAALSGTITMRVRNSFFNTPDPCNFDAGEVEDYVVQIFDNLAPTASCQDFTVLLNDSGSATIVPANIDNGSLAPAGGGVLSVDMDTFDCDDLGDNLVTLTITDVNNNESICTATVTVEDATNPIAIAQNLTVELDINGMASITTAQIDNGSSDNCSVTLGLDVMSFNCDNLGANTVTLTVTDASLNAHSQTAVVTVEDNISPTVIAQNFTVELDINGSATITPAQIDNGSSDNCSITMDLDITSFSCDDLGINTVILTVTDAANNTNTQTATVTVEDNLDVLIEGPIDFTQYTGFNETDCGMIINYDPVTAIDNCDPVGTSVLQTVGLGSGSFFPVGTTTETYEIMDGTGTITIYTFDVTVVDATDPVLTNCPSSTTETVSSGTSFVIPDYTNTITVTDNCDMNLVITQVPDPGVLVAIGTSTNVTLTAEDADGNETICSFNLTVEENLGVDDVVGASDINLYPNPVIDKLHIISDKHGLERLTLFDMRGSVIMDVKVSGMETILETKDLQSTMYLVSIQTASGVVVKQIIKN
ncbi:MAG: photosystem II stability/assembly factor-like uncharacterized protein [Flavobacteriales bacterium]|jgi:photosystem II stability/assembly factor-like uncharacterized protein